MFVTDATFQLERSELNNLPREWGPYVQLKTRSIREVVIERFAEIEHICKDVALETSQLKIEAKISAR